MRLAEIRHPEIRRPRAWRGKVRAGWAVAVLGASLFGATAAQAREEYPARLQERLGMGECLPTCTLCHTVPTGGLENLNLPIGAILGGITNSVDAPSNLPMLLESLEAANTDGDDLSDLAELRAGRNPGVHGDASICSPTYGCGARIAPLSADAGGQGRGGVLLLLGLGLGVVVRRALRSRAAERAR